MQCTTGTYKNGVIHLDDPKGLANGQKVAVVFVPIDRAEPAKVPMAGNPFPISGSGEPIRTLDDWRQFAPPKNPVRQWKEGRSAQELARYWLRENVSRTLPEQINALLKVREQTKAFEATEGFAELKTPLDNYGGETRNHDLVIIGTANSDRTLITIEGKADEPFGSTSIGRYFAERLQVTGSKVPDRIKRLCNQVFGVEFNIQDHQADLGLLRYQLLTAVAGTLIEAANRQAVQAVFLVQEFRSRRDEGRQVQETSHGNLTRNFNDLTAFLTRLPKQPPEVIPTVNQDFLVGPFLLPGGEDVAQDFPLFIGKVSMSIASQRGLPAL
jgi:hypothetical protein